MAPILGEPRAWPGDPLMNNYAEEESTLNSSNVSTKEGRVSEARAG